MSEEVISQEEYCLRLGKASFYMRVSLKQLIECFKQLAEAMQEIKSMQEQAALEIEKIQGYYDAENILLYDEMEWCKTGWGYKPKLNQAARKPHRAKLYWHRTRSFCVRRGYH